MRASKRDGSSGLSGLSGLFGWSDQKFISKNQTDQRNQIDEPLRVARAQKVISLHPVFLGSGSAMSSRIASKTTRNWLACGDDEAVVFDPDGFNLRWELEFVSIYGRVEQLMDDAVEGGGWDG